VQRLSARAVSASGYRHGSVAFDKGVYVEGRPTALSCEGLPAGRQGGQTGTHNAEVEGSGASLTTNKNEFKEKAVSSCIITMMR